MSTRRGFLAGILAAGFAPAAIGSGVLMPVRKIVQPFAGEVSGMAILQRQMTRQEAQQAMNLMMRQMMDNMGTAPLIRAGEMLQWHFSDGEIKWKKVNPYR
jgi:outer membrane lipoprotein SlyB